MEDYIPTFSKKKFDPLQPSVDDIIIEDIARALSLIPLANGHLKHFYSVAQHVINASKEARSRGYSEKVQLGCLLHDTGKCYISDLPEPLKKHFTGYTAMEEKIRSLIFAKYGLGNLPENEALKIKEVNDALLYYETGELTGVSPALESTPKIAMEHDFSQRDFANVENEFIYKFKLLTQGSQGISSVGVDGGRSGWVAVNITDEGFAVEQFSSFAEICSKYSDSDSILVDMPIGLPESRDETRPDAEARRILSSRSSCIFNTPCRDAVYTDDYREASEINKIILGKGLSKQSFAICSNIREIDQFLTSAPAFKNKIKESHPEICFAMLQSTGPFKEPIYESKHTPEGQEMRLRVLERYYDQTAAFMECVSADPKLAKIVEDCIDALCLAVTGKLGIKHGFKSIPEAPMPDSHGMTMQMVYADTG